MKQKSPPNGNRTLDKVVADRDLSAFEVKEEAEPTIKENIAKQFVDNIPLDIIKEMATTKLVTFGLIAYGIIVGIFLYFSISGYIQGRKEEFVSLDSSSGECSEVTRTLTGDYYASSYGLWEGNVGYKYTDTIYEFQFQGMKTTDAEFKDTLNKLKKDQLIPLGNIQEENNLAYNLLIWMHYSTRFTIGTAVQIFGLSGEPSEVFNRVYTVAGIANTADACIQPKTSYDVTTATTDLQWSAQEYGDNAGCTNISSLQDLGYLEDYDGDVFSIQLDLVTITSAVAANLQLLNTNYLESVGDLFAFNITYGGVDIIVPVQKYFDPRFPGMSPYYCVFEIAGDNPDYAGSQSLDKLEGKCLPETAPGSGLFGIPVFTLFQADCELCSSSRDIQRCNDFDLLVGFISYGEDLGKLFQLMERYDVAELNELVRPAMVKAVGFADSIGAFDFCDNECYVLAVNSYDFENKAVGPYYNEILGHCRDSINFNEYKMLAGTAPDDLVETYFRCKPTIYKAFFDAVGIANGNTALFAPLATLFLLVPLIKLYFKTTGQHLHEDEYTADDKDAAAREMMNHLICVSQGKTKVPADSLVAQFVAELRQLSIADREEKQLKKNAKVPYKSVRQVDNKKEVEVTGHVTL